VIQRLREENQGSGRHSGPRFDRQQETNRQISELRAYAASKGYEIVEICRETISGNANGDERHVLRRAEALAIEGKVKKVLVHEISRLLVQNVGKTDGLPEELFLMNGDHSRKRVVRTVQFTYR
jgi:DNA invertase Pin-like site-specific DNA recombinase